MKKFLRAPLALAGRSGKLSRVGTPRYKPRSATPSSMSVERHTAEVVVVHHLALKIQAFSRFSLGLAKPSADVCCDENDPQNAVKQRRQQSGGQST